MENNTTIATMKEVKKIKDQEALGQSKWYKVNNWFKTKAWPWIEKAANMVWKGAKALGRRLLNVHINWVAVLALVILVNMAKNGTLDNMPSLKWLIESTGRLFEWMIGLLRNLLNWAVDLPGFEFGFFGMFEDWVKNIFAM